MNELVARMRRRLALRSKNESDRRRGECGAAPVADMARGIERAWYPPPIDHTRQIYKLEQLIAFQGEEFVTHVYRCLLKREPDATGFDHFVGKLWPVLVV